jgi:hypothetical protein
MELNFPRGLSGSSGQILKYPTNEDRLGALCVEKTDSDRLTESGPQIASGVAQFHL